ncbi:MAG: S8 family serine peptidase, partial [Candidatus Hodarchaeales archaeon]
MMRFKRVICVYIISILLFLPMLYFSSSFVKTDDNPIVNFKFSNFFKHGTVGNKIVNPEYMVGQRQDSSYQYINLPDYDVYSADYSEGVTIAVIDWGLNNTEWATIETDPYVDVDVTVVTFLPDIIQGGTVAVMDNPWDPLTTYALDNKLQNSYGHGLKMISIIAAVVPNIHVLLIDLNWEESGIEDGMGFYLDDNRPRSGKLWKWLYEHADEYDIDIISSSIGWKQNFWNNYMSLLRNEKEILMLQSAGNFNKFFNIHPETPQVESYHPQIYPEFRIIGSVDHEDRGTEGECDHSWKDHKSGESYQDILYLAGCAGSSWFDTLSHPW